MMIERERKKAEERQWQVLANSLFHRFCVALF